MSFTRAPLVATAGTIRPPRLLVRDTYSTYDTGLATLRPYAHLIGADVDDLRTALESTHENAATS
jgi:tRNA A-37 threonylcarbamoyl transferase component Bud32